MRIFNSLITHAGMHSWLWILFSSSQQNLTAQSPTAVLASATHFWIWKCIMTVSHKTTFFNAQLLSTNEDKTFYSENCEHLNCYSHQISFISDCCLPWQYQMLQTRQEQESSEWYFPVHSSASPAQRPPRQQHYLLSKESLMDFCSIWNKHTRRRMSRAVWAITNPHKCHPPSQPAMPRGFCLLLLPPEGCSVIPGKGTSVGNVSVPSFNDSEILEGAELQ